MKSESQDRSNFVEFTRNLSSSMDNLRLPNGGYATDLAVAIVTIEEANSHLGKLNQIDESMLEPQQRELKTWAKETIGKCNQIVLDHVEKYPYLFRF